MTPRAPTDDAALVQHLQPAAVTPAGLFIALAIAIPAWFAIVKAAMWCIGC